MKKIHYALLAFFISLTAFAQKPSKELYEGITKGDLPRVQKAVEAGADVNKPISMKSRFYGHCKLIVRIL